MLERSVERELRHGTIVGGEERPELLVEIFHVSTPAKASSHAAETLVVVTTFRNVWKRWEDSPILAHEIVDQRPPKVVRKRSGAVQLPRRKGLSVGPVEVFSAHRE